MHILKTHWIDIQSYKKSRIEAQTRQTILQDRRTQNRYRRLWFYFFEYEITNRIRAETTTQIDNQGLDLVFSNPELQALAQRA